MINPQTEDLLVEIHKETNGKGADIVIDAVGVLLLDAIGTVKASGSILLFGQNAAAKQEICQNDITGRGITIYGNYTLQNVANVLDTHLADFTQMITHTLPLSQFAGGQRRSAGSSFGSVYELILGFGKEGIGMKRVRIGVIGAGWMGRAHTTAFHNAGMIFGDDVPVFEMISDINEEQVKTAAKHMGYNRWTTNWRDIVTDSGM